VDLLYAYENIGGGIASGEWERYSAREMSILTQGAVWQDEPGGSLQSGGEGEYGEVLCYMAEQLLYGIAGGAYSACGVFTKNHFSGDGRDFWRGCN